MLTLGAPLCLLATPYGWSIVSYYARCSSAARSCSRCPSGSRSPLAVLLAVPFFITVAIAVWAFGRNSSRITLWEKLALLALAAGSIAVVRNVLFFALFALLVVPVAIRARTRRNRGRPLLGAGPSTHCLSGRRLLRC